jgi:hypothetical protein
MEILIDQLQAGEKSNESGIGVGLITGQNSNRNKRTTDLRLGRTYPTGFSSEDQTNMDGNAWIMPGRKRCHHSDFTVCDG